MKRDMELVRLILKAVEEKTTLTPREITIEGYDRALVARHMEMLEHAGYLEVQKTQPMGLDIPTVLVKDMSWEGHEFLAAIGDDGVFSKVKKGLGESLRTTPLAVIKDVATAVASEIAMSKLGLK